MRRPRKKPKPSTPIVSRSHHTITRARCSRRPFKKSHNGLPSLRPLIARTTFVPPSSSSTMLVATISPLKANAD
jgi:hypothetical protein